MLSKTAFEVDFSSLYETEIENLLKEENENSFFKDSKLKEEEGRLDLIHCKLSQVHLLTCTFEKSSLVASYFENCDLSNTKMMESSIHNVYFKNCKLLGLDISLSSLRDIKFEDCILDFSNFSLSKMSHIILKNCMIQNASFNDVNWKAITLEGCNFSGSEFLHTSLKGLDFSTSMIENIKVDKHDLKGVIVDERGALLLSQMLGVIIKS